MSSPSSSSDTMAIPISLHCLTACDATTLQRGRAKPLGAGDSYLFGDYLKEPEADYITCMVVGELKYQARDDEQFKFPNYWQRSPTEDERFYAEIVQQDGQWLEQDWEGTVLEMITFKFFHDFNEPCNHVVVNQCHDGSDYSNLPRDKPVSFSSRRSLLILSLGESRILRLKCVKGQRQGETQDILLSHGSLFLLGPDTNKYWEHSIIKSAGDKHCRISLTYRVQTMRAVERQVVEETHIDHRVAAANGIDMEGNLPHSQSSTQYSTEEPERKKRKVANDGDERSKESISESDHQEHEEEEEYEVEAVVDQRSVQSQVQYLVHWRGYPTSEMTWEPESHLTNASEAIQEFWDKQQKHGSNSKSMQ